MISCVINHLDLLCKKLQDTCTYLSVCILTPFISCVCACRVMSVVVMKSAMHVMVEERVHVSYKINIKAVFN